jgi:inner membrane protein
MAGRELGKKALLWGAFAHSLPDFDFISHFWTDTIPGLLSHRGFTHSISFGVLSTLVLTVLVQRIFPRQPLKRTKWWLLFSVNIFAHIFLDTFNAYGTGWFEPFAHNRFSFHILYVADPFFSIWPLLAVVVLAIISRYHSQRKWVSMGALGLCVFYLCYAFSNKAIIRDEVNKDLKALAVSPREMIVTPAPFNSWLWYVVAKTDSGYYTAYRSVFDTKPTEFTYYPVNTYLLDSVKNQDEVKDLTRFAGDYYTIERWNDTVVFNVLRFGQVAGWYEQKPKFTFYCFLDRPGSNELVVQRGRFEGWNRKTFHAFWERIRGN